jgi:hypothetical protein
MTPRRVLGSICEVASLDRRRHRVGAGTDRQQARARRGMATRALGWHRPVCSNPSRDGGFG